MSIFGRWSRKSGPFRFTLSRSGLSSSVGGKRARFRIGGSGKGASFNFGKGVRWSKRWR